MLSQAAGDAKRQIQPTKREKVRRRKEGKKKDLSQVCVLMCVRRVFPGVVGCDGVEVRWSDTPLREGDEV